jgi:hypothetical protein
VPTAAVIAALAISFSISFVIRSLRDFRSDHSYVVNYSGGGRWEKIKITSVPEFCGIQVGASFPGIWLRVCPNVSTEIVPFSEEDEVGWVSRIPESKAMISGHILEITDKTAEYYDENASRFVVIGVSNGHGGLERKWFKLLIDGTIVGVH